MWFALLTDPIFKLSFMERNTLVEQNEQDLANNLVQTPEKTAETPKKKRTAAQKIGRQRLHELKTEKACRQIEQILEELSWFRIRFARTYQANFTSKELEGWTVEDEVDREIIQRIKEAGLPGVLLKDAAADVNQRGAFNLRYYDVSRRILRMNKRLHKKTGNCLFEKRGHAWALTKFGFESYDEPTDALSNEDNPNASPSSLEEEL